MSFSATVIADSVSQAGVRLTTLQLRYPRFIHAEFMTHRVFSRNASSSRAIPVKRLIEDVLRDPAMPVFWGKNQPGMQAREEHDDPVYAWSDLRSNMTREETWLYGRDQAVILAKAYSEAGYHKQIVNRLLEPWAHINVVVTATEWENFFKLRLHPDAQPEIHELAKHMKAAMDSSTPLLSVHHLPYILPEERSQHTYNVLGMISAARCARVSYMTHEGKAPAFDADMKLATRLLADAHMSPFEHAAVELDSKYHICANFVGWQSYRTSVETTVV